MSVVIRVRRASDALAQEITDESIYLRRREFLRGAAVAVGALAGTALFPGCTSGKEGGEPGTSDAKTLAATRDARYSTDEEPTSFKDATRYNNFYEFGTDKTDPARYAGEMITEPWSVSVEGEVDKPRVIAFEDLLKAHPLEERIYRLRCVEAWSMVIPWIGFPLADLLKRFTLTSFAKFVEFRTLLDPEHMPGQRTPTLDWPYREGLRLDEAMHPLTLLAVGMYGRQLPNQNGAPLRLVVPWKYGFKSIKSIVAIKLTASQPATSWNTAAPDEYGFYSNVNPDVDHPRWSQKNERRIGEFLRRPTLKFNGYGDEVAGLYAGMDLRAHY
jgi:methionine sulfoxide reductase catalytic subunit